MAGKGGLRRLAASQGKGSRLRLQKFLIRKKLGYFFSYPILKM